MERKLPKHLAILWDYGGGTGVLKLMPTQIVSADASSNKMTIQKISPRYLFGILHNPIQTHLFILHINQLVHFMGITDTPQEVLNAWTPEMYQHVAKVL